MSGGKFPDAGLTLLLLYVNMVATSQRGVQEMVMQITGHTRALWITSVVSPLALLMVWRLAGYGLNVAVLIITAGSMIANSLAAGVLQVKTDWFRVDWRGMAAIFLPGLVGAALGIILIGWFAPLVAGGLALLLFVMFLRVGRPFNVRRTGGGRTRGRQARDARPARLCRPMTTAAHTARVLHLINGEFYAGAERVQDLLALQLGRHGFEVEFACLKDGIFAEKRLAKHATLHAVPMKSRVDVSLCHRLTRLVRAGNIRLLHTHTPRTALMGNVVSLITRVPMIHHVHSPAERDTESGCRNIRNSLVERISLHGARRLIAVSASLERHLRERGLRGRTYPVGPERCAGGRLQTSQPSRRVANLTLGMVALFRPRKGIEVLLEAMSQLRAAGVPVRLHAVGPFETPAYERTVVDLTRNLGLQDVVTWAGFRSDISAEFSRMHVFVLPSLFGEGMPMVVLEAMAAGLPVVSTRDRGHSEIVRHGQDGCWSKPGDSHALADALLRFCRREVGAGRLGDSGWQRQRENFSDISMAAGVANDLPEVLKT